MALETNSVLQHAMGGAILGQNDRGIYTAVAKADGGYDIYHVLPDGYTVELSSFQDAGVALNKDFSQYYAPKAGEDGPTDGTYSGGTGTQGLSAEQISAAISKHNANLREIDRAYQEGLLTFKQRQDALEQSRYQNTVSKDEGLSSNQAYFNNVSPDAFQSQIGNYNQKVMDAYQQGENTINNDQSAINFAKQNFTQRTNENRAAEGAFNAGTGQYTGGYAYKGGLTPNAPDVTAFNANLPSQQAARLGGNQWTPNYGGLSTMQAKKETDPLQKYLNQ